MTMEMRREMRVRKCLSAFQRGSEVLREGEGW